MNTFSDFALSVPDLLLPKNIDTASWSCIACDQYTQDRNYWKEAEKAASGKPSALNLILPEVYLGDGDKESRIAGIQAAMKRYIDDGLFEEKHGFVYVEADHAITDDWLAQQGCNSLAVIRAGKAGQVHYQLLTSEPCPSSSTPEPSTR